MSIKKDEWLHRGKIGLRMKASALNGTSFCSGQKERWIAYNIEIVYKSELSQVCGEKV